MAEDARTAVDPAEEASGAAAQAAAKPGPGLSSRLLFLTILFVMIAEVLIFLPSIANFRLSFLRDRIAAAQTAALVLEAAPADAVPETLVRQLLDSVGAETIALRIQGRRRLLAISENPPMVSERIDLREPPMIGSVTGALATLLWGGERSIAVIGAAPMGADFVEITLPEAPLRHAMLRFSGNILALSLFISGLTAALVFFTLRWLIVRPVERLTRSIVRFARRPDDLTRIMRPSGRTDEIGRAEEALAGMQRALSQQLKQQERLAALGLAVAKINHDLRNMLSAAQLISDRLSGVSDPIVQRFAPKLIQTLDRAIAFCQSSLVFGRAEERPPEPQPVALDQLIIEVASVAGLEDHPTIDLAGDIAAMPTVVADPEHLFRIIVNIARNAVQAMEKHPPAAGQRHRLIIRAHPVADDQGRPLQAIDIIDTGPGVPAAIRAKLFTAFHGTTSAGGSGLGLAIAGDLARAQGGDIVLLPGPGGATFRITLPWPGIEA